MKLVTFENKEGERRTGAFYQNDTRIVDLERGCEALTGSNSPHFTSIQALIEGGEAALDLAAKVIAYVSAKVPPGAWLKKNDVRLLAPLPRPAQMRDFSCFMAHIKGCAKFGVKLSAAMGNKEQAEKLQAAGGFNIPKIVRQIPLYYKCNRFAVIGTGEDIVWPTFANLLDYELELAAVIGKKGKDISRNNASDYIFGYTIFNDISARDYQMKEMGGDLHLGPAKGKDFDTSNIIGPCIVTADEISPDNLTMVARVNGEEWSRGNSGTMYHKFQDCVAYVSRCETIYPGELFGSGTVGTGCGFEQGRFLSPGDIVELEIEGIGTLSNKVVGTPVGERPYVLRQIDDHGTKWRNLGIDRFPFRKGLYKLTDGVYAWIVPDGSWGLSNAGLIVDGDNSLLIDTLIDLETTQGMLTAMKSAEPEAASAIDTLVITHGDGDHWFGAQLVENARIISSRKAAGEMENFLPLKVATICELFGSAPTAQGRFIKRAFGGFNFQGIKPTFPTVYVDKYMGLEVGNKIVELIEVGPTHTHGDLLVYLPKDRILFAGDVVFCEVTPVIHAGPVQNWIDVCRKIMSMDVDIVVPGHGPVTDKRSVEALIAYFEYVREEAMTRYELGMDAFTAAKDIALKDFQAWRNPERIVMNVTALYREFSGGEYESDPLEVMTQMGEISDM